MRLLPSREGVLYVGQWELVLELGPGVYLARKSGPRRFARLGALRSFGAGMGDHDPLLADIGRASAASHPLICTVQDAGESSGERFVVSQYVEGGSLHELVARGAPPPIDIAAAIAVDALAALHAVHDARDAQGRQLVHGAVTPSAVIVGADGRGRLSDLGLRRLAKGEDDPLGVRAYAAPEVLRGIAPDATSDVYAMGRVIYELFAGRPCADADGVLPLLSSIEPRVPVTVAEVVARATAPDRDHRFRSADAFAAALEDATPRAAARAVGQWVEDRHALALAARRSAAGAWSEARAEALGYRPPGRWRLLRVAIRRRLRRHRRVTQAAITLGLVALGVTLGLLAYAYRTRVPAEEARSPVEAPAAPPREAPPLPEVAAAPPDEGTATEIEIEELPSAAAPPPRRRSAPKRKRTEEPLSNPYR